MSLILRAVAVTDPGLVRPENEDAAHAGSRLIAVADGMGGLPAGEVASEIAIRALAALEWAPADDPVAALNGAVETANLQIRAAVEADPARDGMGTTITAVLLADTLLTVAHVGDSRGYLLRGATLRRLTRDDTLVQALVDQGVLTSAEARRHPQRSLVTRAVQGAGLAPSIDTVPAAAGDRLLLCSDGLSDVVDDQAIGQTLAHWADRHQCGEQLVKLAHQAGAPDNVTVVVADVETEPAPPAG
ncbi:protein phosphatase 2C domain-containing protein [Solwaraspora sp. WMMD1047]|uniref:PP2C family protein-serine/threonine phosphatase n=1 Tax=Solwaraspora sp. WMMD1047 TaxID=3016102 RepID=UPI0024175949|nr:protein phosphatase 2C domain-containing protein [Solwaraspora sp. WMMD1047]MDG4827868.1 protein phosphatase 2C domain-containing protein [Solwaraspora sp. WMMD1047]